MTDTTASTDDLRSLDRDTSWTAKLSGTKANRATLRRVLLAGGVVVVAIASGYFWLTGGRYVSTDNAYIHAPKLLVATDISGVVSTVAVHEGQAVAKGAVLFQIDSTPFRIAVDNARANLAQTALNIESMKQDYQRIQSDIAAQQAQVQLTQATFDRTAALVKTGSTTAANFDQARYALTAAQNQHRSLEAQANVLLSKLGGNADAPAPGHPMYQQAQAQLDEMQRQLDHTTIRAPFSGIATQVDQLQPGMYVAASTSGVGGGAVALVGDDELWVDANFKETDLTYARAGDTAELTVDAYPGETWTGRVMSISPASGAEFSILPPQNASGNWVKIVQRIPVRVKVDRKANGQHALRAGMSVNVTIDTGHKRTLAELW